MNAYVKEIIEGLKICPYFDLNNRVAIEFFVRHGHQMAYEDDCYEEFEAAFPNFFSYQDQEEEIVKGVLECQVHI